MNNDTRVNPALTRRQVLKTLGGIAAAGTFGLPSSGLAGTDPGGRLMRTIPASGETVPAVGLGTARTFSLGGLAMDGQPRPVAEYDVEAEELETLKAVLKHFHAEGGRLVDSSPMYGTAEELVGRFGRELGIIDDLFMATKVWADGREAGMRQMEQSMARLHREPMDIMMIHNLRDWRTHYRTLRDWQEAGRIRHIGISQSRTSAHGEVEKVLKAERFDVLQINYNARDTNADQRLLPLAAEQGVATLINEPFGNGDLFRLTRGRELPDWAAAFDADTWARVFLKFIIAHPAVTCALPATSDPEHVVDNTGAMYGKQPNGDQRRRIAEYLKTL